MQAKQILYVLGVAVCCVTASASEEFMLAYYVKINQQGEEFVLQQHGQRFSAENEISSPIGRGGRGKFFLTLASLGDTTGILRLELYDDKLGATMVRAPVYSLDVEFAKDGAKGDVFDTKNDVSVELSYSVVAQ